MEYSYEDALNELNIAASEGDVVRVNKIIDTGMYDFDDAIVTAVSFGHIDVIEVLLDKCEWGISCDINELAKIAASRGDVSMVNYLVYVAADNTDEIILTAVENGHYHIVESITLNAIKSTSKYRIDDLSLVAKTLKQLMSLSSLSDMVRSSITTLFYLSMTQSTKSRM